MKRFKLTFLLIFLLLTNLSLSGEEMRLLRFPAIHKDQIVFSYAGNLYSVAAEGGVARKLTNHNGFEMFARFSPDGEQLAFTAQYDGNTEVYLMPSRGGVPKRLTYTATLDRDFVWDRMGPNNIVMCWKNDGKKIIFRSRMIEWNDFLGQLFTVSTDGDIPEQLPLPRGGFCTFSPDDQQMAYNRVFREFRTWKRYRGGMADDIWIYDFKSKKINNITNHPAQDIIPMWRGDKIYFLSDRDANKRMNLYVYDIVTESIKQLTHFTEFDIKFPSIGVNAIVFENGGYLYRFDLASEKSEKIPVYIYEDKVTGRGGITELDKKVTDYNIAPDGSRALFGARGEIFTVPAKEGATRNLTATSGVHERNSQWSPDGKWISYISDVSGEDEIYITAQDGSSSPVQITRGADTYKYMPLWSPNSKKLLWSDRLFRLRYVDINSKQINEVAQASAWEIRNYTWSPDSKWIAYEKPEVEGMTRTYLFSLSSGQNHSVTEGWYTSQEPSFSSDGKYLFFTSDRDFNPVYSSTEWNHAYRDMESVYLCILSGKDESPFKQKSDEVQLVTETTKNEKKDDKKKSETTDIKVQTKGLVNRILRLPIQASDYRHITAVENAVYYQRKGSKDKKSQLILYDLKEKKETLLGEINGYEISANGKKMLASQNKNYAIIDLPKAKISLDKKLDLSAMETTLNKHAEWSQIFNECWRQMREYFYIPNLHGLNWENIRAKYQPLTSYVNHRSDLTYIIGEMIAELNVGHAYVGGGDTPKLNKIKTGLLGAKLVRDPGSRYYRVNKILAGVNWDAKLRSPLSDIGVNMNEGDYILAVNGHSTNKMSNIYESLINTAGKQVKLKVNSKPEDKGSKEVIVLPIDKESDLYYYNWVQKNIKIVNEATNGKVGYLHIPDMGRHGLNQFVKYFYPQLHKKALIIDVRGNGGGNVSPMLIERLRRNIAMITIARGTTPSTNPNAMIWGPKVCLMDEFSASDGDLFPYRFKQHNLGKIVGKRSWGGVVGIRGSLPLLDGGYLYKPEFSRYDIQGKKWIIEGEGVEPDIFVDNDPAQEFAGIDAQLQKAIEVILAELKTGEKSIPPAPPYPKK